MIGYYIRNFEIPLDTVEPLNYRDFYYSEEELLKDLEYILNDIYSAYSDKYSFDEFYTKFRPYIQVSVISLNRRNLLNQMDYDNYKKEVKTIKKENLLDYLISFTDECIFYYDYNLNLTDTLSHVTNYRKDTEKNFQCAFSYKALFPEKYHVNKYKQGDRVLYENEEYIIHKVYKDSKSIFEVEDPLNYLYGYRLINDGGYIPNDDRFCYFVVDEDLTAISNN